MSCKVEAGLYTSLGSGTDCVGATRWKGTDCVGAIGDGGARQGPLHGAGGHL